MKTPEATEPYVIEEMTVDGVTSRCVECTLPHCGDYIEQSDHWAFGVIERTTHVAVLRGLLNERCGFATCPHPGFGVSERG